MLMIQKFASQSECRVDLYLALPFEMRQRRRLRTELPTGEAIALILPDHTILRHGDRLSAVDGRVLEIQAQPERLMEVWTNNYNALCRAAYHLGNRHVAVQIGDRWLRFQQNAVLRELLERSGMTVTEIEAPFDPESGAYGVAHRHFAVEQGQRGFIHEFSA